MKKHLLHLVLSLFMSSIAISQNIQSLDDKNGFREFKIGDPFSKWKSNLELISSSNDEKTYFYKGNCCQTFMGVKIEKISLVFLNNKLDNISILLDETNAKDVSLKLKEYSYVRDKIIDEFGEPSKKNVDSNKGEIVSYWFGNKIALIFFSTYKGYEKGVLNIILIAKNPEKSTDGF